MSKFALLFCITATIFFTSCRVHKNVQRSEDKQESEIKVDSSGTKRNDITKESTIKSEVTETIDTVIFVTPKGEIVQDTVNVKTKVIPVKVHKKKVTKTEAAIQEVDKSKTNVEVKKQEDTKKETKVVQKEITKTGVPWLWWIVIFLIVAGYLVWRFWLKRL